MKTTFQAIENIKAEGNPNRFFRAINEFLPLLYSEYALSLNLNTETELYKNIRLCIQDEFMSTEDLIGKLKLDERVSSLISLFPQTVDFDEWAVFFNKCTWEEINGNNVFVIDDKQFIMPASFLHLVEHDGKYYAYRYIYNPANATCAFMAFNIAEPPVAPIEIDNPFIFKVDKIAADTNSELIKNLELTEEEFFNLPSIKSSDEEQRKAICAPVDKNMVILAGAGSGKTRTLVNRLVYLHLVKKIPLDRILLLTFTKNAAENMKVRGEEIMAPIYENLSEGKDSPNIRAKTIDSFVYGIIRDNYQEIGFTRSPILRLDSNKETRSEYMGLLNETIQENDMTGIFSKYYNANGYPNDNFIYLLNDLEKYACGMSINYAGIERLLSAFIDKQLANQIIYGFVYCNYLVKEAINNPLSNLKQIIASRYDCILMDEFQDINMLQNETFKPFYDSKMHFTFVGDDDQSIYGWRGSDTSIIKGLTDSVNTNTFYLLTNYRNNPNIVKAGNAILNLVEGRAKKNQPIRPYKTTGAKIKIATYDDKYTNLANEVERLIQNGHAAEDISILSRNNDDKNRMIHALTACDIPVARERIKIDVNDNYKLLKAIISILNEYDIIAACREIKRISHQHDLTERYVQQVVLGNSEANEELEKVSKLAAELRDGEIDTLSKAVYLYSLKAGEVFEHSVNDHHSDPVFASFELFCSNNSAPWPISASQLKEIFASFEDNTRKENQSGGALDCGVKTSTIHSAKGLEYDIVMITGLSLGKYPNTEQIDKSYSLRCAQLESLKNSQSLLQDLRKAIPQNRFAEMLEDCVNPYLSNDEAKVLAEFKEDMSAVGQQNIAGLTANGVKAFLELYKYYIDPLKKKYQDSLSKITKKGLQYRERQEILSEEVSLLKQTEENQEDKMGDLNSILEKISLFKNKFRKQKEQADRFDKAIVHITAHYNDCLSASSFLSEVVKLNEIETLKQNLETERAQSINEERRLFYVALTRAKDLLYLCSEEGAPKSEFIGQIPDDLKEEYSILTKEDLKEFNRLKESLSKNVTAENVNNAAVDEDTTKLVSNENFAGYINENYSEFLNNHPVLKNLSADVDGYLKKAMGLLFIGQYTNSDFKTEFAHNIQRAAETLLFETSGPIAKMYKTDDQNEADRIANEIRNISKSCLTSALGFNYIKGLITEKSKFGDDLKSLKSACIFHYIIRSDNHTIPPDVMCSWRTRTFSKISPKEFLVAAVDVANTRNVMIHPSEKRWPDDPIEATIRNFEIIVNGCKGLVEIPKLIDKDDPRFANTAKSDTQNSIAKVKPIKNALQVSEINRGVRVKHADYGIGTISGVREDAFIVTFCDFGNKIFLKSTSMDYFKKL